MEVGLSCPDLDISVGASKRYEVSLDQSTDKPRPLCVRRMAVYLPEDYREKGKGQTTSSGRPDAVPQ